MDRSYLKRPDRDVPPPRSGPPQLEVAIATYQSHEMLEQCLASMAEHLPELLKQERRIPEVRQSDPQPDGRWSLDPGALP